MCERELAGHRCDLHAGHIGVLHGCWIGQQPPFKRLTWHDVYSDEPCEPIAG